MNYDEASDFEINKAVAEALGHKVVDGTGDEVRGDIMTFAPNPDGSIGSFKNFCNYADDAWPIIADNLIDIRWYRNGEARAKVYNPVMWSGFEKNALRAAMIVFLKLKESNNG